MTLLIDNLYYTFFRVPVCLYLIDGRCYNAKPLNELDIVFMEGAVKFPEFTISLRGSQLLFVCIGTYFRIYQRQSSGNFILLRQVNANLLLLRQLGSISLTERSVDVLNVPSSNLEPIPLSQIEDNVIDAATNFQFRLASPGDFTYQLLQVINNLPTTPISNDDPNPQSEFDVDSYEKLLRQLYNL